MSQIEQLPSRTLDPESLNGTEEAAGFLGGAGWEEGSEDSGVVVAEEEVVGGVFLFDAKEAAEVAADLFEGKRTGEIDSPVPAPAFGDQCIEQAASGQLDQIGSDFGQRISTGAIEQRLGLLGAFAQQLQDAWAPGGVKDSIELAWRLLEGGQCVKGAGAGAGTGVVRWWRVQLSAE